MGVQRIAGQGKKAEKIGHDIRVENKLHLDFEMLPVIEPEWFFRLSYLSN